MQSLERMEQLIQSLLKMARLDTGNIVFEKRPCFVSELVSRAVDDLLERAKQEGKEIALCGCENGAPLQTVVVHEIGIFGSDDRAFHVRRDFVVINPAVADRVRRVF